MVERMTTQDAAKLVLKNEIVEVKPIIRSGNGFFKSGHDGQFMFTGTKKTYQLPFVMGTRSYVQIFKTPKEQEAFEVLLGKAPDSLNIYNRESEFWTKFNIELNKEGKTLDLSNVSHAIEYLILKANTKRIAPNWESRHVPSYEFALVNGTQIQEDESKRTVIAEKAMEKFFEIRKSNSKMFDVLRLLDRKLPLEAKDNTGLLKNELMKIIEERTGSKNLKNVNDFLKVLEDPNYDVKVLVYSAIDAGEIKLKSGMFRLEMNDAVMGKSIEQAAEWLNDIQNQEEKIILQQRLSKKD